MKSFWSHSIIMRIIDNFLFHSEYDLLELRLEIMYDHVDHFVIVESDHTFTEIPKEYNLEKNISRYEKWKDKIVYIKANQHKTEAPTITREKAFENESWARNQFKLGWEQIGLKDGDILIVSDCDEIIRPETLKFMRENSYDYYALMSPIFNFKFNYMNTGSEYVVWPTAYKYYSNLEYTPSSMRRIDIEYRDSRFKNRFKEVTQKSEPITSILLHHAAWHFSSLGNEEAIRNKLTSYSHVEYNRPDYLDNINIDNMIRENKNHINQNSGCWKKVKLDDYFPKVVLNNIEKYKKYILEGDDCETVTHHYGRNILDKEV